ncbi:MAG: Fic family protein [Patescibacteria group bacterium]|jgi:Fic family protein
MYQPKFTLNNALLLNIGKIEAAREVIMNAPLLPLWEKRFQEDALVRAIHHGTHLEGNQLDFNEAKEVIFSQNLHSVRTRDVQEVLNFRKVMDYIEEEWKEKKTEISEGTLQKIHGFVVDKILPPNLSGNYRTKRVVIKDSQTGNITFRPPEPEEIQFLLSEFFKWLARADNNTVYPVLKAGIVHHELVRIHPFLDGNGRVSRALTTLILYVEGYDIRRFFSLEEYYDKNPLDYYTHLQEANSGDLTSWLEYFTGGLAHELEKIKDKIKKLSTDIHMKDKLGGKQVYLNERQTKLIEYIQGAGYLQNKAFTSLFPDYSEDTILRDLNDLLEKQLVKKIGKTKGARYELV